jgi:hypothetical protein
MGASSMAECPTILALYPSLDPRPQRPRFRQLRLPYRGIPTMLEQDRRWAAWLVGQAAWCLGLSIREYRELEAGTITDGSTRGTGSASCTGFAASEKQSGGERVLDR